MLLAYLRLVGQALRRIASGSIRVDALFEEMTVVGVNALPVVGVATIFMGAILAMQGAYQLDKLGASAWVADLVSVSMFREIGPLITAIIVIGRSGSAITTELGTLQVQGEVARWEGAGICPVYQRVVPAFLSMVIMVPCLTVLGDCLGLFGGWVLVYAGLHADSFQFITRMVYALTMRDLFIGLLKSVLFGGLIGSIACFYGLRVERDAAGIGHATTHSVVASLTAVLAADCIITALFYFIKL